MRDTMSEKCFECGALHPDGGSCQDDFQQLLGWETEDSSRMQVHHLTVLSYHLQHPRLYSQEGLAGAMDLLVEFLENGKSPGQIRRQNQSKVNSRNRKWPVTARTDSRGSYIRPPHWTMTAADVIAGGADSYCDNVAVWANSIFEALKSSQNLPDPALRQR